MQSNGLIVEFIGLPATGKSFLSHKVAKLLHSKNITVSEPTYELFRSSTSIRRLKKAIYLVRLLISNHKYFWYSTKFIVSHRQQNLSDLFKILFNWLYVSSQTSSIASPGVCLFDQAILQGLWSIGLRAKDSGPELSVLAKRAFNLLNKPYMVVVVHTSKKILEKRLATNPQKHTRLKISLSHENEELDNAYGLLQSVLNIANVLLAENLKISLLSLNNDRPNQLEPNIIKIANCILEIVVS